MSALKFTLDQVRTRELEQVGRVGRPNTWWAWGTGSDCMAAQAWLLGFRTSRTSTTRHEISIAAFRDHFGWDEVAVEDARAGDLLLEEWTSDDHPKLVGQVTHIEFINTINHSANTVNICSGNTGPAAGTATPNGFWRKTRVLNDRNFIGAVRPPYADADDTSPYGTKPPTAATRKKDVRLVAGFLNDRYPDADLPAAKHGKPGQPYYRYVQKWGRDNGIYGPRYLIDGIVGPRTRQVEAVILKRAKAAAKK